MSRLWLKNFFGFQLSEAELRDIPHPYFEVYVHVLWKSIQAFGLIGTVVLSPISAVMYTETRNWAGVNGGVLKFGWYGVLLGCVAGPLMTYARLKSVKATDDAVRDRAYRLRNNRDQLRVDRGSVIGAVSGIVLSVPLATSPITGALFGMSAGIILMAIYNNVFRKQAKKEN